MSGYSSGELAAYYVVWTLLRVFNLAFAPYAWEWRIRRGDSRRRRVAPPHDEKDARR